MTLNAQRHPTTSAESQLQFVVGNEQALNDTIDNPYNVLIDNIPSTPEYTAPHFAIIDRDQNFTSALVLQLKPSLYMIGATPTKIHQISSQAISQWLNPATINCYKCR